MATKMNDKKDNNPEEVSLLAALPEGALGEVDLGAVKVPATADAHELVLTARAVVNGIPVPRTAAVEAACSAVVDTCDLVDRAFAHNAAVKAAESREESGARALVIGALAPITGILGMLAQAQVPELAEEGKGLKTDVFGADFEPTQLSARTLCNVMRGVEAKLVAQPTLRDHLVTRVPEALLVQLFAVNARLGTDLKVDGGPAVKPKVSTQVLRSMLRQHLGHLVEVLAATAVLGGREAKMEVRMQLQPVLALSVALAPRRRASAGEADGATQVAAPEPSLHGAAVVPTARPPAGPDE